MTERSTNKQIHRSAQRRVIVALVRDRHDYEAAAAEVLKLNAVFENCLKAIESQVEQIQENPTCDSSLALRKALEDASDEITEHLFWQKKLLSLLPKKDIDAGVTEPLALAFAQGFKERTRLLNAVTTAYDRYFKE